MVEHAGVKNEIDFEQGELILINKPIDWTSFDVVARIRSMFHIPKIGHAGTLDPKATGLLLICTGKMTKVIDQFSVLEKEYTGVIELGSRTKSFDSESEVIEKKDFNAITQTDVDQSFQSFLGYQKQLPPMFSAVKKNGRRLYKDARKGREIEREFREVFIKEFSLLTFEPPYIGFKVICSKGTYIRSLANDCGSKLGCGAYLKQLTRTRIGPYQLSDAYSIDTIFNLDQKLHTVTA